VLQITFSCFVFLPYLQNQMSTSLKGDQRNARERNAVVVSVIFSVASG